MRNLSPMETVGVTAASIGLALGADAYFDNKTDEITAAVSESATTATPLESPTTTTVVVETTTTDPERQTQLEYLDETFAAQMDRLLPAIDAIRNSEYGFEDPRFPGEHINGVASLNHFGESIITITSSDEDSSTYVSVGLKPVEVTDENGQSAYATNPDGSTQYAYLVETSYSEPNVEDTVRELRTIDEINLAFTAVDEAIERIYGTYTPQELWGMHEAYLQGE